MKVVTVANTAKGYFTALQESCRRHGLDLIVLGWNKEWKGFHMKFELFRDYLDTQQDDDVCAFVDAFDVLAIQTEAEIMRRYRSFGKPIVLGVEKCPPAPYVYSYNMKFGRCRSNCINSGMYIGEVWALRAMLKMMQQTGVRDDQVMLQRLCDRSPWSKEHIAIDSQGIIFRNLVFWPRLSRQHQDPVEADHDACFLHRPGNGDFTRQLEKNGLGHIKAIPTDKAAYYENHAKQMVNDIRYDTEYRWKYTFVAAVCILIVCVALRAVVRYYSC